MEIGATLTKYKGARCVIQHASEEPLSAYISFGDYLEKEETDSYGVPDDRIYYYYDYEDIEDFLSAKPGQTIPLDEGTVVLEWELVEA